MNEELLIRYRTILNSITNELPDKKYISKEHLFWMLEEIEYKEEQSLTKKHINLLAICKLNCPFFALE